MPSSINFSVVSFCICFCGL